MGNEKELEKNFDWYLENLDELAGKYPEMFIAIKGRKVLDAYDTFDEAVQKTELQGNKRGTFLVQKASLDPSAFTITHFNSFIGADYAK